MELIALGKEMLQTVAEHAVSYRFGQMLLRNTDRALWVLEKTARWAVPPPLDQDDRPQPELVRPLPWVFFLVLLVVLRVTRESVSLVNLVMGKPPLRSADVVMYIQGKRRYLRTLKYQGNRMMRARTSTAQSQAWYSGVRNLVEMTMCFRRHAANNNSTRVNDNEQILVVKRNKKEREAATSPGPSSETTMERLLEKMMVDLNADSEDDSSYTLTNATSIKSDSEIESDHDTVFSNDVSESTPDKHAESTPEKHAEYTPEKYAKTTPEKHAESTPEKHAESTPEKTNTAAPPQTANNPSPENKSKTDYLNEYIQSTPETSRDSSNGSSVKEQSPKNNSMNSKAKSESLLNHPTKVPKANTKEETQNFIRGEKCMTKSQQSPKKKIANGRVTENPTNKKGNFSERRESSVPAMKVTSSENNGSPGRENSKH